MKNNKGLSDTKLETARSLYMQYKAVSEIAEIIGEPRTSIQYYVNKEWRDIRELKEAELISGFADERVSKINTIAKHTVDTMIRALESLKNRDKPPTMLEAKAAATMFESIDKILRLDKGQATDIIGETKPITIIELRKEFAEADPFYLEEENDKDVKDNN
jgi:hypothetical protein